ncbi:MAG: alpha-L-glutamate ligase-like protein [Gammaproteobacteria bacterium]|nr:alpha-L-glutamate ligase-like protein [Gammaproteobacteria bacterium]MDH4314971.1 alpha-L-glutamate ligase-like protein [Gammaproteobacteria bacterium]MDH5214379.1 alpha-L-glutamate ligase-like protein [Gammaproteobacteria bacterium]MDH5500570.1 alpha-L-glutamate ligase-like protein [Gammaproteobacteria bacterium]
MLETVRRLRNAGVLGLNERNADFIMRLNPRHYYPRVDDKVLTKKLAIEAGMAVPELYGVIDHQGDVRKFAEIVEDRESFVIKPAQGSGGDGIIVIVSRTKRKKDTFRTAGGLLITTAELEHHISNIVSGQYSLSGGKDVALIEYCVQFDPLFEHVSYQGVPDIRVIVYRGYPVMAMVRLPTRSSDGKANLHQGAVGAGIDMSTGMTLSGVLGNDVVDEHPDTGALIAGLKIPQWDFILQSSARGLEVTELGYLGVDMVIDRNLGPLILEMNARPGLNIQIANGIGISGRTRRIDEIYNADDDPVERARISRIEFAAERQESLPLDDTN